PASTLASAAFCSFGQWLAPMCSTEIVHTPTRLFTMLNRIVQTQFAQRTPSLLLRRLCRIERVGGGAVKTVLAGSLRGQCIAIHHSVCLSCRAKCTHLLARHVH